MIQSDRLWLGPLGRRRRPEFDWISMAREDRLGRRLRPQFDGDWIPMDERMDERMGRRLWDAHLEPWYPWFKFQVLVLFHYILHKHEFIYEFNGHEMSHLKSWSWNLIWIHNMNSDLNSWSWRILWNHTLETSSLENLKLRDLGINLTDTIQTEQ